MVGSVDSGHIAVLSSRRVVSVSGADARKFLGDMVTGDVEGAAPGAPRYAALLSPQGKVLFDFILHAEDDRYLLDIHQKFSTDFINRLNMYRLRAEVTVEELADHSVVACWADACPSSLAPDPRTPSLGYRGVVATGDPILKDTKTDAEARYHAHRIAIAVPEMGIDFGSGDAFPHDIGMDALNGIDFQKGCYVGQEVVSRMQHRGTARRRVLAVAAETDLPPARTALTAGGREVGTLGSSTGANTGFAAIAIARLDRVADAVSGGVEIQAEGISVTLRLPDWANYGWPESDNA